jgi:hypothetical protein
MCSQGRSWAEEGTSRRVTSEWHQGQVESFWVVAGARLSGTQYFPNIQTTLPHKQKIVLPPGTMLRKLSGE